MKIRYNSLGGLAFVLIGLLPVAQASAQDRFELGESEVVVFAGGTNMFRLQQAGYLETILTNAFAAAKPKFRDLAWEADTVFRQGTIAERWREDGFGGRDEQFARVGATVVIAQFGLIESMAGPEELGAFVEAYNDLISGYLTQATRVVLVSPTPFEKPSSPFLPDVSKYNNSLALYVDATRATAAERSLGFVDLFTDAETGLTDNGMHVTSEAQLLVAEMLAKKLGITPPPSHELSTLHSAVLEKHRLWFDYWRPSNWKLLYGDDSEREFTRASEGSVPFREEWMQLIPIIATAEERVWTVANGGKDPGHNRPAPEVLHADETADIETELAAFTVPEGMQVNLFASEKDGLTSPLAIRWDTSGRMYVTVTTTYPHVFPGDLPNDKVLVLEDLDGDGEADKSTVFAEGLNIPTGLELGDDGVYVGQKNEILFLKDTDGDNKADERHVFLGGFGDGDSHQTINSFIWSPSGELYMGQGDGIESRVETPWGSADLYQAGFYRLRPRRLQMDPLLDDFMGPGNPWGVEFDDWGQIYSIDGAGGVTHLSLGQIPAKRRLRLGLIGSEGGYCGISYLDGGQLPESFQGNFAIGDYKSNRVKCFSVTPDGAGANLKWEEPLLYSKHRNFRPVDVSMGPDGAVYVVDFYNPLICHQDDRYRDPTRDKAHGRIWRVSSSSIPLEKAPNLAKASTPSVVSELGASERWTRYQAKRELTQRDTSEVASALKKWVKTLDPSSKHYEHNLYEALGAYATIEVVEPALLGKLLEAKDPRGRAFASRIAGRWHDRVEGALELLTKRVQDDNAQVRLEAVAALAAIPSAESITAVARAVDRPMDESMEYVFSQAIHHMKPQWEPAFKEGELTFAKSAHLAEVLSRSGNRAFIADIRRVADSDSLDEEARMGAIAMLISVGGPEEVDEYGLNMDRYTHSGKYDGHAHAGILAELIKANTARGLEPGNDPAKALNQLMVYPDPELSVNALTLAGLWDAKSTKSKVLKMAKDESLPTSVRAAAFGAAANMKLREAGSMLREYAGAPHDFAVRGAAIEALAGIERDKAAVLAVELFNESELEADRATKTLVAFLNRDGGVRALTTAIDEGDLSEESARSLLLSFYGSGRSDELLLEALNAASGTVAADLEYDPEYVANLSEYARDRGSAQRGAKVFKMIGCTSCHTVGDAGGVIGPNLTTIGTTLSAERIIEETLWPNRQIKEGYSALQVITTDGNIHQGYARRTRESEKSGDLVIQDLVTQELITLKKDEIEENLETGSPMPAGLTSVLTQTQLLDLIQYLLELGSAE